MNGERETRDFMSVDSFSQLPFARPVPTGKQKTTDSADHKPPGGATPIRLFGIEFPHENDVVNREEDSSSSTTKENASGGAFTVEKATSAANGANSAAGAGESGRKFECHYCCRNFPTSQALGGHQNAHKRERQHAKRAHLQSALAAAHHHHPSFADGSHLYGLVNYHRVGAIPSSARFGIGHAFDPLPPAASPYPSWGAGTAVGGFAGPRFYGGGPVSMTQPISNGSPLPAMWRASTAQGGGLLPVLHRERPSAAPFMGDQDHDSRVMVGGMSTGVGSVGGVSFGSMLSSQSRIVYDPASTAGVKENLSLDLHL